MLTQVSFLRWLGLSLDPKRLLYADIHVYNTGKNVELG